VADSLTEDLRMRTIIGRAALPFAIIVATVGVVGPRAQMAPFKPLTEESLRAAVAEGQKDGGDAYLMDLMLLRITKAILIDDRGQQTDLNALLPRTRNRPFYVSVRTPYGRAVIAASEAKRKFLDPPLLSVAELNAEGVMIDVTGGSDFTTSGTIQDLVIKKGESVIRPFKKHITQTTIQNRLGATRPSAEGQFYFALDSIPSVPFGIVCIGAADNVEMMIVEEDLNLIR
jgi:hypothetical protein